MIKVCHIVNHITGRADGVYAHLKMIFTLTDKNKFQHYLIFQGGEKIERELSELGIKFFVCKSLTKKFSIRAFKEIFSFIKENEISIIHAHLIKPYVIAGLLNIILKKKLIFNYHGLFIYKNEYYNVIEKFLYASFHFIINLCKAAHAALVPSEKSKQLLLDETKLFPKILVYYNSYSPYPEKNIDENVLGKINEVKKTNLIIAIASRLDYEKRINVALYIFAEAVKERENISLIIFGEGKQKNELEKYSISLGLKNKVYFYGFIENVSVYFKYFDILLFTSEREGLPVTVWEAMGNKLPVLSPDVGGFKEILAINKCGLVYSKNNFEEAKDKLIQLIDDENLRKEMGVNGFKALNEKYSPDNFKGTIEKIYLDLLS